MYHQGGNEESLWFNGKSGMLVYFSMPSSCGFITTPTYYVNLNGGQPVIFEKPRGWDRGIIVPLFVSASNGVPNSGAKKRILGCKEFKFHPRCQNMQLINLYFEDNWMIFTRADLLPVQWVKSVLKTLITRRINAWTF